MKPNKIYVIEYRGDSTFGGKCHFVIVVAASDSDTAKRHVKEQIGLDGDPVWLMNSEYPTIMCCDGSAPATTQVKILYNGTFHTNFKYEAA